MRFRWWTYLPHVVLLALLAAGAAFALATQFPRAEILERAGSWPVVGSVAQWVRARYIRPHSPAAAAVVEVEEPAADLEVEVVHAVDPELVGIKPKVWAPAGTAIHERPDRGSRVLTRVQRLFPLSRLERRGDWFRVRFGNLHAGLSKGWVFLPEYREPTAEELSAPAPVLPLPAASASRQTVTRARSHMARSISGTCGPYRLVADSPPERILDTCRDIGSGVEAAYERRYRLDPVGQPAETLFVFAEAASYDAFRGEVAPDADGPAHAHPAMGYAAMVAAPPGRFRKALLHELTHLLNRRAIGPALPPWLDEGMARDLADVGVVGMPEAARTAGTEAALSRAEPREPRLPLLPGQDPIRSLRDLLPMDSGEFRLRRSANYRAAGLWMGYFLDGPQPELASGLRAFLADAARGERIEEAHLLARLGRDWPELESGFFVWVAGGAAALPAR